MSDAWDGRPQNPERDGIHALEHDAIWGGIMWWSPKAGRWIPLGSSATFPPSGLVRCYRGVRYLGPCATPADLAASQATVRDLVAALREIRQHHSLERIDAVAGAAIRRAEAAQ